MWSLHEDEKELKPLIFSNGKSQKDIVKEVTDAIKQGFKIIFIKGACGTGKSAIALNLARQFGKTSIVVPIKSLQEQYLKDYSGKKYLLKEKDKKEKLKIGSIIGRQNFKCRFLEENYMNFELKAIERNAKLTEVFEQSSISNLKTRQNDKSCDNNFLPCKIEIKEKNTEILKEYLKKNPDVSLADFSSVNEIRRMSIAPVCPYWSPILSSEIDLKKFKEVVKTTYQGLEGKRFTFYRRKPGCSYYEQYSQYADSDVVIFNSLKYKIENLMNRKPATELEIIDECDEFLDSFTIEEQLNLNKLSFALSSVFSKNESLNSLINELADIINAIKSSKKYQENEIYEIKNTLIEELFLLIFNNQDLIDLIELEEHSYLNHLIEVVKTFSNFFNETFFLIEKRDNNLIINFVTTNLEKRFKELLDKNKVFVMMSGTIHSEKVLESVFGLKGFKTIEAETKTQGDLIKCRYGYELDCSYENFKKGNATREQFLKALSKTIHCAKKPALVHVTSFSDLPTENEKLVFSLDNLPTQQELINEQSEDPFGKRILDFKKKKTEVLFTTKCNRGIDFPGEMCNSIIITRFPYPNISSVFWKIFKKTKPSDFMKFYMDKARRELLQRIYRGLRSKNDRVYLLSPDIRVLEFNFA